MFICPRKGCRLAAMPPTQAHDPDMSEDMKTCPKCSMCFWVPSAQLSFVAPISTTHLNAICAASPVPLARLWLNAIDYADLRKFCRDFLDIESDIACLKKGLQASFQYQGGTVSIWTRRNVEPGFLYAVNIHEPDPGVTDPSWKPERKHLVAVVTRV